MTRIETGEAAVLPFEEVYRRYTRPVYLFCLSQLRNPADAEDVAADVFTAAFAAYARTSPDPSGTLTWLMRISRNTVIDHARKRRRRSAVLAVFFSDGDRVIEPSDVEREVVMRDELRFVLSRMRDLGERDRTLVGLRIAADLPYAAIGEVLGISEHAATMAVKRALQRLRKLCEGAGS